MATGMSESFQRQMLDRLVTEDENWCLGESRANLRDLELSSDPVAAPPVEVDWAAVRREEMWCKAAAWAWAVVTFGGLGIAMAGAFVVGMAMFGVGLLVALVVVLSVLFYAFG